MVDLRQNSSPARAKVRCAVYTRKSSEEGLEQEFNSLDAQREACEAYVTSQKHEGWTALATLYDDGAYSGGTMDRPALQRLLDDVRAGKIDVVVGSSGQASSRCVSSHSARGGRSSLFSCFEQ